MKTVEDSLQRLKKRGKKLEEKYPQISISIYIPEKIFQEVETDDEVWMEVDDGTFECFSMSVNGKLLDEFVTSDEIEKDLDLLDFMGQLFQ